MSLLAPSYALAGSEYTIQLRPLVTNKEDADAGRQHYAVCLWHNNGEVLREICAISGFVIPIVWREEDGHPDLFAQAKRVLLTSPDNGQARKRGAEAEMGAFFKTHVRWLASEEHVAEFEAAIDARIAGTSKPAQSPKSE